jgi:hypothetical protein
LHDNYLVFFCFGHFRGGGAVISREQITSEGKFKTKLNL